MNGRAAVDCQRKLATRSTCVTIAGWEASVHEGSRNETASQAAMVLPSLRRAIHGRSPSPWTRHAASPGVRDRLCYRLFGCCFTWSALQLVNAREALPP